MSSERMVPRTTRAFNCDSCGELFEGESPAAARINVRVGDDFAVPRHLREESRSAGDRVRELVGDGPAGQNLLVELCLACTRELVPEPPEGADDPVEEPD